MGLSVLLADSLFVYSSFPSTETVCDIWTTMLLFVMLFTNEMNVLPNTNSQLQILVSHNSQSSMVHQNVCEICYLRTTENPWLRRCDLSFSKWGGGTVRYVNVREKHNLEETDVHFRIILKSIFIK